MEAKKANFEAFLRELVKNRQYEIWRVYLNTGKSSWYEEGGLNKATDYLFSLTPEKAGLCMRIGRLGLSNCHVCINPTAQKIHFDKESITTESDQEDRAYISKIATQFGFQEVEKWEDLYKTENIALATQRT